MMVGISKMVKEHAKKTVMLKVEEVTTREAATSVLVLDSLSGTIEKASSRAKNAWES